MQQKANLPVREQDTTVVKINTRGLMVVDVDDNEIHIEVPIEWMPNDLVRDFVNDLMAVDWDRLDKMYLTDAISDTYHQQSINRLFRERITF